MLGSTERMKTSREEEQVGGMETIKGGFPLPTNRLVRNCDSSGKLSKLDSMPVCCWEGALLQAAALLPKLLGPANPFSPQLFLMLSLVIELWIPNLTSMVWSPHQPASSPYSPAVSTPDPAYPLGTSVGSWQLCTPTPKLKIFFPETCFQKLNKAVF